MNFTHAKAQRRQGGEPMKTRFFVLSLAVLLFFVPGACSRSNTQNSASDRGLTGESGQVYIGESYHSPISEGGRVVLVEDFDGDVMVSQSLYGSIMPAYRGLEIPMEEKINTEWNSWVSLELGEENFVLAEQFTDFTITRLDEDSTRILLDSGTLWFSIKDGLNKNIIVNMPSTAISVTGTVFSVHSHHGIDTINVYNGSVTLRSETPDGAVLIDENGSPVLMVLGEGESAQLAVENGIVARVETGGFFRIVPMDSAIHKLAGWIPDMFDDAGNITVMTGGNDYDNATDEERRLMGSVYNRAEEVNGDVFLYCFSPGSWTGVTYVELLRSDRDRGSTVVIAEIPIEDFGMGNGYLHIDRGAAGHGFAYVLRGVKVQDGVDVRGVFNEHAWVPSTPTHDAIWYQGPSGFIRLDMRHWDAPASKDGLSLFQAFAPNGTQTYNYSQWVAQVLSVSIYSDTLGRGRSWDYTVFSLFNEGAVYASFTESVFEYGERRESRDRPSGRDIYTPVEYHFSRY